jgi:hypothetical protein
MARWGLGPQFAAGWTEGLSYATEEEERTASHTIPQNCRRSHWDSARQTRGEDWCSGANPGVQEEVQSAGCEEESQVAHEEGRQKLCPIESRSLVAG